MIIRIVKTAEVEVESTDITAALDEANDMDSEGSIEYSMDFYDAETGELLN